MPDIIDHKDDIPHILQHIRIPILIEPPLIRKHRGCKAPNPASKRILLNHPTVHLHAIPLMEAAGHMRDIIHILVVVDNCVVAVVRDDVGVEEADLADSGGFVDLDSRDVLLVEVVGGQGVGG